MKRFKHILMVFLAVLLLVGIIPLSAMAAENHDNQVRVIVENQTLTKDQGAPWSGKLVDEWVDIDSSSTMMSCVKTALDHHKYSSTGTEKNYITEINGLSAGTGEPKAGWMGTLNDWCTSEGFGAYTVKDKTLSAGDVIDIQYSMNYGEDIGGTWNNNDKTLKDLSVSTGTLDPTFASATKSYTLTLDQGVDSVQVTPTANNKNFQVKTYLGTQESGIEYRTGQAIPVKNGSVITVVDGDPSWPTMNQASTVARETYTINVKTANTAPELASGVISGQTKTIEKNGTYSQDLSKIFTDADGNPLTYTVSVNGAKGEACDANYTYQMTDNQAVLKFTANDGQADSPVYQINLTTSDYVAPALKDGVKTIDTVEKCWFYEGSTSYEYLTAFDYFTGTNLTYTVTVDGGEPRTVKSGDWERVDIGKASQGTHTYVFQASDGINNSPAHTVIYYIRQGGIATISAVDGQKVYSLKDDNDLYNYTLGDDSNNQFQFKATVAPATADQKVTWSIEDYNSTKIADIDQNGIVTLKNTDSISGSARYFDVCATTADGSKNSTRVQVSPDGLKISQNPIDAPLSQDGNVKTTSVALANDYYSYSGLLSVAVADPSVATVKLDNNSENLVITPIKPGSTTVTVTNTKDTTKTDTATINVTGVAVATKDADTSTRIYLSRDTPAPTLALKATGASADETFTWKSSDESIATVDANGVVTGHKVGPVTITAVSSSSTLLSEVKGAINLEVAGQNVPYLQNLSFNNASSFKDGFAFSPTIMDYNITLTSANVSALAFKAQFDSDAYTAKIIYKDTTDNETSMDLTSEGNANIFNAIRPGDNTYQIVLTDKKDSTNTNTYTIKMFRPYTTKEALTGMTVLPNGKTAQTYPLYQNQKEGTLFQLKDDDSLGTARFVPGIYTYKCFAFDGTDSIAFTPTFNNWMFGDANEHVRVLTDGKNPVTMTNGITTPNLTLNSTGATVFTFQVVSTQEYADKTAAGEDPWGEPLVYTVTVDKVTADAQNMKITSAEIKDADSGKTQNFYSPGFSSNNYTPSVLIDNATQAVHFNFTVPNGYKVYKGSRGVTNALTGTAGDTETSYSLKIDTANEKTQQTIVLYDETSGKEYSYQFTLNRKGKEGVNPSSIVEYLCLGSQYTNSGGFGMSPEATILNKPSLKSLGNFGGHITYKFDTPVTNDAKNPDGVDFIASGNCFGETQSSSEPGAVQVSQDGKTWYTLAGSVHYDDESDWQYSMTYTKTAAGASSWTASDGTKGENYKYPLASNYPLFSWNSANEQSMTVTGEHLTANAKDPYGSASAAYPDFGYVDSHANGTAGQAENPYLGSGNCHDGMFDLDWAVDDNGNPVQLDSVSYVRIGTASNIYAGAIGEKSTEVSSVYTTQNKADADVGRTDAPGEITVDGAKVTLGESGQTTSTAVDGDFDVKVKAADGANVYINGEKTKDRHYDAMNTHKTIRVIVQEGEKEPYIVNIALKTPDEASVANVIALIDGLKRTGDLTLDDTSAVDTAKKAYDALSDELKAQVPEAEVQKLTDAENKMTKLENDKAAADTVTTRINGLPATDSLTLDYKVPVEDIRRAYDALTADQKGWITPETLKVLTDAEAKMAALEKADAEANQKAADAVSAEIAQLPKGDQLTLADTEKVTKAREDYEALTPDQKALVTNLDALKAAEEQLKKLGVPVITSFTSSKGSTMANGATTTLKAIAAQGHAPYTYQFSATIGETTVVLKDYNDKDTVDFTPKTAGDYVLTVRVMDANGHVASESIKLTVSALNVTYQGHVENFGWMGFVSNGAVAGTTGQALRMEALQVRTNVPGVNVEYRAHCQNIGWQNWQTSGVSSTAGTTGQALRMEAFEAKLEGTNADQYDLYYRTHVSDIGWLSWVKNGDLSGTTGQARRMEAIQIVIVPKGTTPQI